MRTSVLAFSVAFMATATAAKPVIRSESNFTLTSIITDHEPHTLIASAVSTDIPSPTYTSIVSELFTGAVSDPSTAIETDVHSPIPSPLYTSITSGASTDVVSDEAAPVETNACGSAPLPEHTAIVSSDAAPKATHLSSQLPPTTTSTIAQDPISTDIVNATATWTGTSEPKRTGISSCLPPTSTSIITEEPAATTIINSTTTSTLTSLAAPWPTSNGTAPHNITSTISGLSANYTSIVSTNWTEAVPTTHASQDPAPTSSA